MFLVYSKGTTKVWSRDSNAKPLVTGLSVSKKKNKSKKKKGKARTKPVFDIKTVAVEARLQFLINMANKGTWVTKTKLLAMRKEFEGMKKKIDLNQVVCYVCSGRADHRHHVVPLSRGGSNALRNLIPLCNKHHEAVHPWLNAVPTLNNPSLEEGYTAPCYSLTRDVAIAVPVVNPVCCFT